jgi:hypothetical protein
MLEIETQVLAGVGSVLDPLQTFARRYVDLCAIIACSFLAIALIAVLFTLAEFIGAMATRFTQISRQKRANNTRLSKGVVPLENQNSG